MSVEKLLQKYNIPYQLWGTRDAKSLEHLKQEVDEGESVLIEHDGQLIRYISIIWINVLYDNQNGDTFILRENRQVFSDGRTRHRKLESSVAEKLKPNETANSKSVKRALAEELGIDFNGAIKQLESLETIGDSKSFPGLLTKASQTKFEVCLNDVDYNPAGYTEQQPDKTTYFIWQPL